jgi:succinate-acetate transporter protein
MAVGNTFGATALSSYGGFWISFAIILTPGGFDILGTLTAADPSGASVNNSLGIYLAVSCLVNRIISQKISTDYVLSRAGSSSLSSS